MPKVEKESVLLFLKELKVKIKIWGILYLDERGKNTQTLLDLELRPSERTEIVEKLTVKDFSEGPLPEKFYGISDMWVFGKEVKGKEVYIKITLGNKNSKAVCISFHIAEYPMNYPFK